MRNPLDSIVRRSAMALLVAGMGLFAGSASATLLDRGPNLVYDDVLNITWVRDASLCVTLNNCVNRQDTFLAAGGMTWEDANAWAASLVFEGFDDWRLPFASLAEGAGPTTTVVNCNLASESACRDNEMAYMFYYNLAGTFGIPETGNQTALGGEALTNIQRFYWSATQFSAGDAWDFDFLNGGQGTVGLLSKGDPLAAWAVRTGDVVATALPEPSPLVLLATALGAFGLSRRCKAT